MDERVQEEAWRKRAGWVGTVFSLILFLSILDALVARFRDPLNLIRVAPGIDVEINGPLEKAVRPQDLTYRTDAQGLHLSFAEVHSGYFLGGTLWRGRLAVMPGTEPGEYELAVLPKGDLKPKPSSVYKVCVYADPVEMRVSGSSFIKRSLGVSPWLVALAALCPVMLSVGFSFHLSRKIEQLMAKEGMAEVFRVKKGDQGLEVYFGLGMAHGLNPGASVDLIGKRGERLGTGEVIEVTATEAVALVGETTIRPGDLVSLQLDRIGKSQNVAQSRLSPEVHQAAGQRVDKDRKVNDLGSASLRNWNDGMME